MQSIWRCLNGLGPGNFENWNFENFLQFGHQILVAVLVTLQDLVTLWSSNAIKTASVVKSRGMPPPKLCGACSVLNIFLDSRNQNFYYI